MVGGSGHSEHQNEEVGDVNLSRVGLSRYDSVMRHLRPGTSIGSFVENPEVLRAAPIARENLRS